MYSQLLDIVYIYIKIGRKTGLRLIDFQLKLNEDDVEKEGGWIRI